jgi:hypothetical protein
MKKTDDEVIQDKELEYYAASVSAWFTTSLEYDRSIFVLSAGGIGVLVSLLTTKGVSSLLALALYIAAMIGFLLATVILLRIFRRNGAHILAILRQEENLGDEELLSLDKAAMISFAAGVAFSIVLGIVTAYGSYIEKEQAVANKQNKGVPTFDSVLGAANLQPKALAEKSFHGAGALQPKAVAQSQSSASTPEPAPAPASTPSQASGTQSSSDNKRP